MARINFEHLTLHFCFINRDWSTPIIKVLAGSDKQIFYMQPDAFSSQSPICKSRLGGSWKYLALAHLSESLGSMPLTGANLLLNTSEALLLVYEQTHATISEPEPAEGSLIDFLAKNLTQ